MQCIHVEHERDLLYHRFKERIEPNPDIDRKLVSYQAAKATPFYRWFKYKEGFTSQLVHYLLEKVHPSTGILLDPFAGSGTALFGASALGWHTYGIELLPVGIYIMQAHIAAKRVDSGAFATMVAKIKQLDFAQFYDAAYCLRHVAITQGAFPPETEQQLVGYVTYCKTRIDDRRMQELLLFACFCILEEVSYTRKDGQYLRWDARSGRSQGAKPFNKGAIHSFSQALHAKLDQMVADMSGASCTSGALQQAQAGSMQEHFAFVDDYVPQKHLPTHNGPNAMPHILTGSCLNELPQIHAESVDVIMTSPPYCNRYDYTRTYALELVFLGSTHAGIRDLRQAMLSCTVENKEKHDAIAQQYAQLGRYDDVTWGMRVFESQAALQEVLFLLDASRRGGHLNNPNILRMVRNYFYEMCFVVLEMARILTPGGHVLMVNDNVRYAGEEVPVDIILSSMAESFGLVTEKIWTLTRGKGNSSQQMGAHGRSELRKCVYVWRKPIT